MLVSFGSILTSDSLIFEPLYLSLDLHWFSSCDHLANFGITHESFRTIVFLSLYELRLWRMHQTRPLCPVTRLQHPLRPEVLL